MTQLTIQPKNHYIVFHDGSYMPITQRQMNQIFEVSSEKDALEIDGQFIKFSAIQKILEAKEFLSQYSHQIEKHKKLERLNEIPYYQEILYSKSNKINRKQGLVQFIKGLKKAIKEREANQEKTTEAIKLLKKVEKRLTI